MFLAVPACGFALYHGAKPQEGLAIKLLILKKFDIIGG
jgi:hypothetical protein